MQQNKRATRGHLLHTSLHDSDMQDKNGLPAQTSQPCHKALQVVELSLANMLVSVHLQSCLSPKDPQRSPGVTFNNSISMPSRQH